MYIPSVLFVYRTLRNNTTKHEPFFLTYGRDVRLPIDLKYPLPIAENENEEDEILDRIFSLIHHLPDDINTVQNQIRRQ